MWKNLSKKLEWLLIVVVLAGTVMLGGCGGNSDPHTPYVISPDKVVVQSGPVSVTAILANPVGSNVAQTEFSVVSHTSAAAPTITDIVQNLSTLQTTANINITEPGTYVFKAAIGGVEDKFAIVYISIDAGPDQVVAPGSTVTLTGNIDSATLPVGSDATRIAWYSYESSPSGDILRPISYASVTNVTASGSTGTFKFCADSISINILGESSYLKSICDTVTITENSSQLLANAGADQSVAVGDLVSLDGRGSSSPISWPIYYQWGILSRPGGSVATLTNATAATPTFTPDVAGDYVIFLSVTNSDFGSIPDSDTVTVTASATAPANTAPLADAGPAQYASVGYTVTLNGSASSDADSNPLTYAWTLTTRPAGSGVLLTGDTTATPSFVPDVDGNYVATLVVNDGTSNSVPDMVTVSAVTSGPITSVTALENALANNTFLVAHATAPNGLLELYEFGASGLGGSLYFAYIDPMSFPFSHTREWSVTDKGTYIEASETSPFFALNSAAPVNATDILTMTGYAGTNTNLGGSSVESWIKVATVSTGNFSGKTVVFNNNTTIQYEFTTATTGQYTFDTASLPKSFTWAIDSGGHKAVVTFADGSTHRLYLTVRGASGSALREMGVVSVNSSGIVTGGSLQNWIWQ